jgi:hypothetical protein
MPIMPTRPVEQLQQEWSRDIAIYSFAGHGHKVEIADSPQLPKPLEYSEQKYLSKDSPRQAVTFQVRAWVATVKA